MKVIIYTTSDCKFSKEEIEYLKKNKLEYTEKALENNKDNLQEMLSISSNFAGTPVTQIQKDDGQTIILKGFTSQEFDKALGIGEQPQAQTPDQTPPAQQPTPMASPQTPKEEIKLEIERRQRGETTTWKKMEKVRKNSEGNVKYLKELFGYSSLEGLQKTRKEYYEIFQKTLDANYPFDQEKRVKLEEEIQRINEDFTVTVNMTWANVIKSLEAGKVISIWENPEVMRLRNKHNKYNYEYRRDEIERLVGNRSKGGRRDPHPIYAAAASPNKRDEYYGGTGGGYGECFLVLKTDKIRERTSFCYDDSFDGYNRWLVDWEGGIVAKAIHNLNDSQSMHGYVEAQILGGVALDDIESINISSNAIDGENEYGWSVGSDVLGKIEQLRKQYPEIKINIVEVPK